MFIISKIVLTIPITYKIIYLNGEDIEGSFYEQELQKTTQVTFRIEKVLKKQGDKCVVKWMRYPKSFHCCIDAKAMVNYSITWCKLKSF